MARMYSSTPPAMRMAPPTMSGPAHGVEVWRGHEIEIVLGAGFAPSVATRTLVPAGRFIGAISTASCWNSSSQRSEPTGLCDGVAGAAAAPPPSPPPLASPPLESPPLPSELVTLGATAVVVSLPALFTETSSYEVSASHALRSDVRA